jgi:hypothetical protein
VGNATVWHRNVPSVRTVLERIATKAAIFVLLMRDLGMAPDLAKGGDFFTLQLEWKLRAIITLNFHSWRVSFGQFLKSN